MNSKSIIYGSLALVFLLSACKKDESISDFNIIDLGTTADLRCILVQNDSLIVGGGNTDEPGFLAVYNSTNEAASLVSDQIDYPVYASAKFGGKFYFGLTDFRMLVSDSLPKLFEYSFREKDWIIKLNHQPFRQMLVSENGFLAILGGKLSFGAIFQSYDGAQTWSPIEYDHDFRCISQNGNQLWVGGNGALLHTTFGDTVWTQVELDNRFIVGLHFSNENEGVAVCYEGELLHTTDGGQTWKQTDKKRSVFVQKMLSLDQRLLVLCSDGVVGVSENDGGSFRWIQLSEMGDLHDAVFVNDQYYIAAENGNLIQISAEVLK